MMPSPCPSPQRVVKIIAEILAKKIKEEKNHKLF